MKVDTKHGNALLKAVATLALGRELKTSVKSCLMFVLLATDALLSGCASFHNGLVLDPVGPAPAHPKVAPATNGSLLVYSTCVAIADSSGDASSNTSENWEYTGYKILSPDGKLLKYVQNNAGWRLLHPQQIELPVGKHTVVAAANGYGPVTVPIIIASNQITVLHLDGDGFWPREPGFTQTNTVHLPDGQIVGWRCIAETSVKQ